jgi:hypothetical protein
MPVFVVVLKWSCRHTWSELPTTVRVKFLLDVVVPSLAVTLMVVVPNWSVVGVAATV